MHIIIKWSFTKCNLLGKLTSTVHDSPPIGHLLGMSDFLPALMAQISSVGEVWIFSRTTHWEFSTWELLISSQRLLAQDIEFYFNYNFRKRKKLIYLPVHRISKHKNKTVQHLVRHIWIQFHRRPYINTELLRGGGGIQSIDLGKLHCICHSMVNIIP